MGGLSIAKSSTQHWSIVAKMEEKDFIDKMAVYDVVPRSDYCGERVPCCSHQMGYSQQGVR